MITVKEIDINQETGWEALISQSQTATFFQAPDWLRLWMKHFGGETRIFGIYEDKNLVGIAPLFQKEEKIYLLGLTGVLGNELVSDFGDIIAKTSYEKRVWKEVLANLKNNEVILNFIREDSPSFGILKELGVKINEVDVAPYIDLPRSWDEYLASLDRKDRHELKRKIRRLEEQESFTTCNEGNPGDIDEFIRLMALSNDQKRDFLSSSMKDFFGDVIKTFWSKKMISLCFLKIDSKNIASVLVFEFKDEILLYNSGFDPAYQSLSPGFLLKAFVIKQAIEEGKKRFDFLRGGERYKYDLGGKERKLYNIIFN